MNADDLESRLRQRGEAHLDLERFRRAAARDGLLDVAYARLPSPLGDLLLAASPAGLVRIAYLEGQDPDLVLAELAARVSPRILEDPASLDEARRQLDDYFEGRRRRFELDLDWTLVGPFGRRVLGRTAQVPYGEVSTYGAIAAAIGTPGGSRATGNALGANPIPIVVPCHRIVRSGGALGGYAGGVERKAGLLALERAGSG